MKIRNKETGEIGYLTAGRGIDHYVVANNEWVSCGKYNSLAELNAEWEDVPEEPKWYWYVDDAGVMQIDQVLCSVINMRKSIGNYFDTREEAELAVRKLKAWKRLKDKGFEIVKWTYDIGDDYHKAGQIVLNLNNVRNSEWDEYDQMMEIEKDLDLLFGGEE